MTVRAARSVLDVCERFDASVFEELFIVAGVTFEEADGLAVEVVPAEGEKCPRCWNYRELGGNPKPPATSARAAATCSDEIGYVEPDGQA